MGFYNKIKLYPNQSVDYLIQITDVATQQDIELTNESRFIPDWGTFLNRTNIMAPYTRNLISSYITGLDRNLKGWTVYRQKNGDGALRKIAELDKTSTSMEDYGVSNQSDYKYFFFPITDVQIGVNLATPDIHTEWWNWSLTSLENIGDNIYIPKEIWIFDTNLDSGTINQNLEVVYHKNFTKYPKESRGEMNYISGSLSCLLCNIDNDKGEYLEPVEKLESWRKFCADDSLKVIKDRKGNMRLVSISDITDSIMDESDKQPSTISFSYTEIGDINEISIYKEVI